MRRWPAVIALLALLAPPMAGGLAQAADDATVTNPAAARHVHGLKFKAPETYRGFERSSPYRALLPPAADLSAWFPPPRDQGDQSSCVAWSVGYAMRGYYANRAQGKAGAASVALSPAFVYNQIVDRREGCDAGSDISDALDLLRDVGTVTLARFPYRDTDCSRQPPADVKREAGQYRIANWRTVAVANLSDIKGQIVHGDPVVIGMNVNDAFDELKGEQIFRDTRTDGGGHAMVVVGYDDAKQAFKLVNSWGPEWGQGGFGWVSYTSFKARVDEAYVASVPNLPAIATRPTAPTTPVAVVEPGPAPPTPSPRPRVNPVAPSSDTVAPPPQLSTKGRASFEKYLAATPPKAFAMAEDGSFAWRAGRASEQDAKAASLAACAGVPEQPCRLVMVGDRPAGGSTNVANTAAAPEGLSRRGEQAYQDFLAARNHKAFAMNDDGSYGWRSGRNSADRAAQEALDACESHTDTACHLVMVDDRSDPNDPDDPDSPGGGPPDDD